MRSTPTNLVLALALALAAVAAFPGAAGRACAQGASRFT